jgi:tetratricopeptide (TPR) repeat protein
MPNEKPPGLPTGNSRAKADSLRKAGEFAAAAEAYAAIWPDGDRWTGWAYALCLRKIKSPDALSVAHNVFELAPDFELGRSVYAWALSDSIRRAEEPTPVVLSSAEKIIELTVNCENAYSAVSPFVATVLLVSHLLSKKGKHKQVLEWLSRLDPDRLNTEERRFVDPTGKTRTLASHRERYFSLKSHALEKLGRWEECLAMTQFALTACAQLHHDNNIWFARRIALAKIHVGSANEGIKELEILAARKPASFLYYDIAEAVWNLEDADRATKNCLLALQSPGEIGFKLAALLLLSRLLWDGGKQEEARKHLSLYMTYRREKGWSLGGEVNSLAIQWGVPSENGSAKDLLKELTPKWREWSRSTEARRSGTVQSLFPHGRSGFIVANNRERFFFHARDWKDKRSKPKQGSRVTFATKPSFDPKHNKPSVVACEIMND